MKAIIFDVFGAEDVLHLDEVPEPELRPGDLLVRVAAAGVNRADLLQRTGAYGRQNFGDSEVMGLEISGTVTRVGHAVEGFAPGDRVMGIVGGGAYAEFARIDHDMAVRIPDTISFIDAAAIMESFVTAVEAVSHLGRVSRGCSVLVHAAAGGVGSACVQLASALGATVYATASTAMADKVRNVGASHVLDYRSDDFAAAIPQLAEGGGVDAIIDFIGGDYLARNLRLLKAGGTLVQVGLLSQQAQAQIPLNLVLHNHLQIIGTVMKSRTASEKTRHDKAVYRACSAVVCDGPIAGACPRQLSARRGGRGAPMHATRRRVRQNRSDCRSSAGFHPVNAKETLK